MNLSVRECVSVLVCAVACVCVCVLVCARECVSDCLLDIVGMFCSVCTRAYKE